MKTEDEDPSSQERTLKDDQPVPGSQGYEVLVVPFRLGDVEATHFHPIVTEVEDDLDNGQDESEPMEEESPQDVSEEAESPREDENGNKEENVPTGVCTKEVFSGSSKGCPYRRSTHPQETSPGHQVLSGSDNHLPCRLHRNTSLQSGMVPRCLPSGGLGGLCDCGNRRPQHLDNPGH